MAIIYMAVNTVNNKCYIGKTIQSLFVRKNEHISRAIKGNQCYFHRAIHKYGKDKFEWDIVEEVSKEDINKAEIFWISYYRSIGVELYNMTSGGDGGNHTKESRLKMSKSRLGNKNCLGKKWTEEHKQKTSASLRKEFIGFVCPNGKIYTPVKNLKLFCIEHHLIYKNLHSVALGKNKTHKGWKRYIPE